jgi:hypothetical protein
MVCKQDSKGLSPTSTALAGAGGTRWGVGAFLTSYYGAKCQWVSGPHRPRASSGLTLAKSATVGHPQVFGDERVVGPVMLRKTLTAFFVLALLEVGMVQASDRFDSALLKSVLRIETSPTSNGEPNIGGGFLVTATEDATGRVFLVTNKHMIGDWNYADGNYPDLPGLDQCVLLSFE